MAFLHPEIVKKKLSSPSLKQPLPKVFSNNWRINYSLGNWPANNWRVNDLPWLPNNGKKGGEWPLPFLFISTEAGAATVTIWFIAMLPNFKTCSFWKIIVNLQLINTKYFPDESELVRRQDDILYDLPVPVPEQQSNRVSFSSSNSGQANQANGDIYNRMYADRGLFGIVKLKMEFKLF